jgi:hypothetical protein
VIAAIKSIRRDPKTTKLPLPAVIRQRIAPELSDDNMSVLAANKIWDAIAKFGWPNHKEAKTFLGELPWAVVEHAGGWVSVCQESGSGNPQAFKAQLRELSKSVIARAKSGNLDEPMYLPEPESKLNKIDVLKFMPKLEALK